MKLPTTSELQKGMETSKARDNATRGAMNLFILLGADLLEKHPELVVPDDGPATFEKLVAAVRSADK